MMMTAENTTAPVLLHLIVNSSASTAEQTMFSRWKREYENYRQKDLRKKLILDAVRNGYDTFAEIAAATNIPETTVRRIAARLVRSKKLLSYQVKGQSRKNGNKEYRFELPESVGV